MFSNALVMLLVNVSDLCPLDLSVPGQPGELQFAALSMTSLNVSWAAPSQPNGIIENYTVSYYEARAKDGMFVSWRVN